MAHTRAYLGRRFNLETFNALFDSLQITHQKFITFVVLHNFIIKSDFLSTPCILYTDTYYKTYNINFY